MEKIWLKNYPKNVPEEINPDTYTSLVNLFEDCCKKYSELPAFANFGTRLTYHEIDLLSRHFAAYLQSTLELKQGSRLAIMMPNLLQYPIVVFGALRAGLTIVNVNPLYTADEVVYQLNDAGVETLVVLENFANTIELAIPHLRTLKNIIIAQVGDCFPIWKALLINFAIKYIHQKIPAWHIPNALFFKDMIKKGKGLSFTAPTISNQDIAFLQYTGGTTGLSKGAILTHRNLIANLIQAYAWFKDLLTERQEIVITALPLYHIFSLTANCLFSLKIGGFNVLITNPRDIPAMIKDLSKVKFSLITGVNTLFNALLKHPDFQKLDFSHLKLTLGGGMAVQRVVAEKWQQLTGKVLLEAYGLTETSPCVTINPTDLPSFNGSIGLPVSSTEVAILDEQGHEVPIGQPGELAVKGPQVTKGYWNYSSESARAFTPDGWFLTGDVVTMDDKGFIRLLERKKDMILVSGFNVYPNELEDVIAKLQGVREVAVIGIPDEASGEVPKAFIVKENPRLTEKEVISYCRNHLTGYKIPREVKFVSDLPKTNVGKILRRSLRELV